MNDLPNEQQLFYSKDGISWQPSLDGARWPDEKCEGYLYKHLTWNEFRAIQTGSIDLNGHKEDKKESLRQSCAKAIESMFQSDALGQSNTYDCRSVDQLNLNMIVNGGVGGEVYTHDGVEFVWEMHTHEQCVSLLQSMNVHIKTQRDKLYQKVSLVNACTTRDEVDAINW